MNRNLLLELQNEKIILEKIILKLQERIAESPTGDIVVSNSEKRVQYFFHDKANSIPRTYIRKKDIDIAKLIIQRDYDKKMLVILSRRLAEVESLIDDYIKNDISSVYSSLNPARRVLVNPVELSDEEYVNHWKEKFTLNSNTYEKPANIETENGERVRSKTEKIIADLLAKENIPYVYEPKVTLKNGKTFFCDFAMLNVRTRKTMYLEHFGIMDNPEYLRSALEKIEQYEKNNLWYGKDMLYTFETQYRMPDIQNIKNMIRTFLK